MSIPDSLQTISEISIGLAGFSGLIVALRRTPGPLTDVQKYRLRILFAMTFGAMFLSLLPDLLLSFQVPEERIWFDSSAAMFVYSAGFVYWMVTRALHVARVAPEIFNWLVFSSLTAAHIVVLLLQLGIMTGFIEGRAPGAFTLGLIWYLAHAAQQFVRMMFILPRNTDHG
jgi:hypothetical protein